MPNPQSRTAATQSPDRRFREQFVRAVAHGVPVETITLRDKSLLVRDRTTPVADICYEEGMMHFLGVKIESIGVAPSSLDLGQP